MCLSDPKLRRPLRKYKKGKTISPFLGVLFFCLRANIWAGGIEEDSYQLAKGLINVQTQSDEEEIRNNTEALELLEDLLERYEANPEISDRVLSNTRILLAKAYYGAREYNSSIKLLAVIMKEHPDRFDDAEQHVHSVRQIWFEYNDLLNKLVVELGKDSGDPEDPFNEANALEIITHMESLFPVPDPGTAKQIESNKKRVKVAVDRNYQNQILLRAHELIEQGEYLAAIDRYISIEDIDSRGFYQHSFDLQKEEFLDLGLPELFVKQVENVVEQVLLLSDQFESADRQYSTALSTFINQIIEYFPETPTRISASIGGEGDNFSSAISQDELLSSLFDRLEEHTRLGNSFKEVSDRTVDFRRQLPIFLPESAGDRDSEYLFYLEQFVSGPAQYENEGIRGAAERQSREYLLTLLESIDKRIDAYIRIFDTSFEKHTWSDVVEFEESIRRAVDFLLYIAVAHENAERINWENRRLAVSRMSEENRQHRAGLVLELDRIRGRVKLAQIAVEYNSIAERELTVLESALSAYESTLDLLSQIQQTSDDIMLNLDESVEFLNELSVSTGKKIDRIRTQHIADRDELISHVQNLAINCYNSYLVLLQNNTPQHYENAVELVETAESKLKGEVQDSGLTYFDPVSARDNLLTSTQILQDVLQLNNAVQNKLQEAPQFIRDAEQTQNFEEHVENLLADSQNFLVRRETLAANAEERISQAREPLEDARITRKQINSSLEKGNLTLAENQFDNMVIQYQESLAIVHSQQVIEEFNSASSQLTAKIRDLEVDISQARKRKALANVSQYFLNGSYPQALDWLNKADEWHNRLDPNNPDPTIEAYRKDIIRVNLVSQEQELSEFDPQYYVISPYLNNASAAVARAESTSIQRVLLEEIESAKTNLRAVKTLKPANFEMAIIELRILQLELSGEEFQNEFVQRRNAFIKNYDNGTKEPGESDQLFHTRTLTGLKALDEINPGDDAIDRKIIELEVALGIRESQEEINAKNQSNSLYPQARAIYNSRQTRADLLRAQSLAQKAVDVYAKNVNATHLLDEIKIALGLPPSFTPNATDLALIDRARTVFFVNNDPFTASDIIQDLWTRDPQNQSYPPLRKLRSEVMRAIRN